MVCRKYDAGMLLKNLRDARWVTSERERERESRRTRERMGRGRDKPTRKENDRRREDAQNRS